MTKFLIDDPYFDVQVLSTTDRPNLLCYSAMHQDYSEGAVAYEREKLSKLSDEELGRRLVEKCVKFNHWGVLEHPSITFNVIGYPHSVMVQARTHRVGVSFDVQSQRYTGQRIVDAVKSDKVDISEDLFYFRPIGTYQDRNGNNYEYDYHDRQTDKHHTECMMIYYHQKLNKGYAPEHARELLPQNIRQNFVVTFNARSLLHFCDLRIPADAQLEIRDLATNLFDLFKVWMPEVAEHYEKTRYGKNKLAP